ncbi:MAG TPA: hypothetical protein VGV57_00085 [Thermoleophilaceae bacterium]|nr:hypothetical protein [Thermoleophilaceae bacterium]
MPTRQRRIAIVEDGELAASLAGVARFAEPETSRPRLVRGLAP